MKLPPASTKRSTICWLVASSASLPNVIVPRQSSETRVPVRPNWRYSIAVALLIGVAGDLMAPRRGADKCRTDWSDDQDLGGAARVHRVSTAKLAADSRRRGPSERPGALGAPDGVEVTRTS